MSQKEARRSIVWALSPSTRQQLANNANPRPYGWKLSDNRTSLEDRYRQEVGTNKPVYDVDGKLVSFDFDCADLSRNFDQEWTADALEMIVRQGYENALKTAEGWKHPRWGFTEPRQEAVFEHIKSFAGSTVKRIQSGFIYEVALSPTDVDFLVWDLPLSKQSPKVQALLERDKAPFMDDPHDFHEKTGSDLYSWLSRSFSEEWQHGDMSASEYLKDIGIPGAIRRSGSSDSAEYVLFDTTQATLKAKHSLDSLTNEQPAETDEDAGPSPR